MNITRHWACCLAVDIFALWPCTVLNLSNATSRSMYILFLHWVRYLNETLLLKTYSLCTRILRDLGGVRSIQVPKSFRHTIMYPFTIIELVAAIMKAMLFFMAAKDHVDVSPHTLFNVWLGFCIFTTIVQWSIAAITLWSLLKVS